METLAPLSQSKRIDLVDSLRGFAIFGILMVNMPGFFKPAVELIMLPSFGDSMVEILSNGFIYFFFTGKFFVLFSLLFGFGFYIFLHKDGEVSKQNISVFQKRLFWLLIIAITHIALLWEADILFYYALFGFLLILFRKSSTKKIIIWMLVFLLIPIVFVGLISMLPQFLASNPEALQAMEKGSQEQLAATQDLVQRAYQAYNSGSYSEVIQMNIEQWLFLISGIIIFYPTCMVMFLMGLLIGRSGFFIQTKEYEQQIKKVFWISLPFGVLLNIGLLFSLANANPASLDYWAFIGRATGILGGIVMMCTYVSGFILLYNQGKFVGQFSGFSAVGRMALTNYISNSVLALFLFRLGFFGLFGEIEVWQGILLVLAIFSFQISFSKFWLSKYRFGPLEWLWRTLTYGKIPAFKL
ncbi:DUF418 domain-containing protein [Cecembia lonarensis]|uniref:DUF418 domain-containing protein n=1 Tax=Cecembia lonarensis (strain CCUG 58316 / KCTC 22772 / LW9) TaxID=1225176 RepID=K1L4B5_CECL9|nr:DUF418 domain-containing protein [Cecembia lonarensis]EKB51240.1 hypothetical protein B879_00034 [Cecembia lonarensis LW9]